MSLNMGSAVPDNWIYYRPWGWNGFQNSSYALAGSFIYITRSNISRFYHFLFCLNPPTWNPRATLLRLEALHPGPISSTDRSIAFNLCVPVTLCNQYALFSPRQGACIVIGRQFSIYNTRSPRFDSTFKKFKAYKLSSRLVILTRSLM